MSTLKVNTIQKTGEGAPVILTADSSGNVTIPHGVSIVGDITTSTPIGPSYYDFPVNSSITFTSSLEGRMGMTLTQARAHLSGQTAFSSWGNNTDYFDVTNGVMFWTVPQLGQYEFDVKGAQAGDLDWDGRGRGIRGRVNLAQGAVLRILVGQQGVTVTSQYSGGGGGSAVALVTIGGGYKPLLIGSGGSGQTPNDPSENGRNTARDARYAYSTDFQGENTPEGGRGSLYQNSYGSDITNYWYGGGGGGWCCDGEEGTIGYWPQNLERPQNRGIQLSNHQPKGGWSEVGAHGGFGGGGSTGRSSGSGGGGGGWRGGDCMYVSGSSPSDNGGNTATCYYDVDSVSSVSDLSWNTTSGSVKLTRIS